MINYSGDEVEHITDLVSALCSLLPDTYTKPSYVRIGDLPVYRDGSGELLGHVIFDRDANWFRYRSL